MEKTVCELFAGVGGFRLGLEDTGDDWRTVWFSQWEPSRKSQWAHQCYVSHWGDIDENTGKDIALVDKTLIPNHNLLVGGFPCQDYSVARPLSGSNGLEGKKGVLWWQIREVLQTKNPSFVLLENVDRLLKSPSTQRGRDFGVMLACLNAEGYSVEWRVINAAEYGAGQRRRRIFIYAYKNTTQYGASKAETNPKDVILNDGFFANVFPCISAENMAETEFGDLDIVDVSEGFKFGFENAGFMRNGSIYTVKVTPVLEQPITLGELLEHDVDKSYYITKNEEKWAYLKGSKKIQRTSKTGHVYTFSEGAIAYPDNLDVPARTMLTSESSLNRSTHVIRDPETNRLRTLTPVEAERIQGFRDNWTNTGMPEKFRFFCMGNALVVPMITRMGRRLGAIMDAEPEPER